MGDYELNISLSGSIARNAQVRAWIDGELAASLACEREVELVRDGAASWTGRFSVEGGSFIYRIGICAAQGSAWSLTVRATDGHGTVLYFDADVLTMTKEWLVGSVDLPSGRSSPEDGAAFDASLPKHDGT